jgi:P-type Cu2+ transporter
MSTRGASPFACPGCATVPVDLAATPCGTHRVQTPLRRVEIALPAIHCAACIAGVEAGLARLTEVRAVRVNLTLKRVAVTAEDGPGLERRLIDALARLGFEAKPLDSAALEATRTDAAGRDLLARIGVAGFALMNVMLLSVSVWTGAADSTRDLMHWISALIAVPAVAFAALPFFSNAWTALKAGRLDMDVPISTAILLAVGVSLYETMHSGAHAFFDAALMLTFFLLIGRYLAHLTRTSARSAAAELAALEVQFVTRLADQARDTVPLDALRPGDLIEVLPGGRIPVDGTVTSGRSEIDPSMLTGETMPEVVAPGATVRAGMSNLSGPLTIRADRLGDDTLLREIARLVETAEQSRTRYATLADRASRYYSHIVNVLAITAFLGWGLLAGDWRLATNIAAAVLIITCPCALGLAVPAVLTAASGRLFRQGVLLKDGTAFERLAEIDTVVFDKTGTLTTGHPVLLNAATLPPAAFAIAAALSRASAHPLARAIAEAHPGGPASVTDITEHPGLGTEGRLDGACVRLGRAEWLGVEADPETTTTWLAIGDQAPMPLTFTDEPRPDAARTVAALLDRGLVVELLSGDARRPVEALDDRLGIANRAARATPAGKVARLEALRAEGRKVLMVGDGLNDAAALAAAHVSLSPASAVDASRSAADLIVLGNRLDRIPEILTLARIARSRITENFAMAFGYNIVTVPIAYAGYVTPLIAAIAMSASSIVVALNATRLGRHERPAPSPSTAPSGVPAE